jgi:hypothetical protein
MWRRYHDRHDRNVDDLHPNLLLSDVITADVSQADKGR